MNTATGLVSRILPAVFSGLLFLGTSALYADNTPPPSPHNQQPQDMHSMHDGMGDHQHMMGDLNLDDKQRGLLKAAMKQMRDVMHHLQKAHEQIREITQSDKFDEKKLRALIHNQNTASEDKIVAASKAYHEFYNSLTPEQKSKLAEHHKQIREHMRERMKEHMQQHQADMHGDDADMMGHDMGDDFEDEAHDKH